MAHTMKCTDTGYRALEIEQGKRASVQYCGRNSILRVQKSPLNNFEAYSSPCSHQL